MSQVHVFMVVPEKYKNQDEVSAVMRAAFDTCKQYMLKVEWVREAFFKNISLDKSDIVVLDSFEGELFDYLQYKKCVILGPWCLIVSLNEGIPIPNLPWPIYNVAMRGAIVTFSHLTKEEKFAMKEKIEKMGGKTSPNLTSVNTHLITNSVKSEKYEQAGKLKLKIMLPTWVDAVWKASLESNVHCSQPQFEEFRCLPFHNLTVTMTGINDKNLKKNIQSLITKNGGKCRNELLINSTDFLICSEDGITNSAKFKAASKAQHIKCVTQEWAIESAEKGYALSHELYVVKRPTSTPTKDEYVNPNFSTISAIRTTQMCLEQNTISDTVHEPNASGINFINELTGIEKKVLGHSLERINSLVKEINLKKVKKAGPFLDGCGIYLAGFSPEHREKLCKVINFTGAFRYDDISDRISHVIVGDLFSQDLKVLQSRDLQVFFVSLQWLIDSLHQGCALPEEKYFVRKVSNTAVGALNSPQSIKGLSLLCSNNVVAEEDVMRPPKVKSKLNFDDKAEDNIINKYLNAESISWGQFLHDQDFKSKQNAPEQQTSLTTTPINQNNEILKPNTTNNIPFSASGKTNTTSQLEMNLTKYDAFAGLKFSIRGFSKSDVGDLCNQIENLSGVAVSNEIVSDYLVLPCFCNSMTVTGGEIVNKSWILQCHDEKKLCPIMYYHRPMLLPKAKPLENCVICISSYVQYERAFLTILIEELGGLCQEQLARTSCPGKSLLPCTHLITYDTKSKKYSAAVKWGLPVVDKDWLFECARLGKMASEKPFAAGIYKGSLADDLLATLLDPVANKSSSMNSEMQTSENASSGLNQFTVTPQSSPDTSSHCDTRNETVTGVKQVSETKSCHSTVTQENKNFTPKSRIKSQDEEDKITPVAEIMKNFYRQHPHFKPMATPTNNLFKKVSSDSPCGSQVTPVSKILEDARKNNLLDDVFSTPKTPKALDHIDTPDTPYGAFIRPNPSPNLRKEYARYLRSFPDWIPPPTRRKSTPLSELKRQLWDKICPPKNDSESAGDSANTQKKDRETTNDGAKRTLFQGNNCPDTPENQLVNKNLQQIHDMLEASGGKRRTPIKCSVPVPTGEMKDSQSQCTVGWDFTFDTANACDKKLLFMISGVETEDREKIICQIEEDLGSEVLESSGYDKMCTHLICPKPARNEKTLACMASGKWVLHVSYIRESVKAGKLLNEELFEFGNPKARDSIYADIPEDEKSNAQSLYWWRKEIARRGYGAFHDVRAIVVAAKRQPIVNVIEAGGGMVIDVCPPFDMQTIYSTHCLIESKMANDLSLYVPLAKKGIYCVNTLYISEFLHRRVKDIKDSILPAFAQFYS